ncbi:hypothetical protein DFQ27_007239 [Actinomortierella ambigua]|uniref:Uncharacterized protein n=1 Tax=Actinomortierella ambigua TaxID=1343610 RepID=A0A9P6PW50_9FUNG|nr:hypothetical protein DFQ27_007239 [Actinomortierella ambigua]
MRLSAKYRAPIESLAASSEGRSLSEPPQRWRSCVSAVSNIMGPLVGYFYAGLKFTEASRKDTTDMINAIKGTYRTGFTNIDWLDNNTRANAIQKLDAIDTLVGWSAADPNIGSPAALEQYYDDVNVKQGDYYGSVGQGVRSFMKKNFARAGKRADRQRMNMDPHSVNAFYAPLSNQVAFPAAFVQPPMYRAGGPDYLNYGSLGFVAGHELTHGFDTNGRRFDATGRIRDWWSAATAKQFNDKAQCLIDQYSGFTVTDSSTNSTHNVFGEISIGENIADNGSIKYSFQTWLARYNADRDGRQFNNQVLPGLEQWTRDQMFFVSFAQFFCTKALPGSEGRGAAVHAPPQWRTNGPLMNLPAFATAFKCPAGSPMNPAKRCTVW